ncbi:T9SS type A sorting domain-containing protein [Winogradskyella tangerina]|uniref:T9SS type A sorting domain-containing protein n=1 Tax=Winogradskyella tangerina TaxID=2023240 RepID=UPI000DBE1601|nr:T9SS type A sorting domain-containing protein [Winogradskyella tangerina]
MRTKVITGLVLVFWCCQFLNAQTTAIPDPIFEDFLETHSADGAVVSVGDAMSLGDGIANNGLVFTDRIEVVTSINLSSLGISDLSGIEDFQALETLICTDNDLTTIDVSTNTNLITLLCGSNFLTEIDVSTNLDLETLNCSDNQIEVLDISLNTALRSLTASDNKISAVDLSNNTELTLLSVSNNRIQGELVVSNNLNLEGLFCASNQISNLDLTSHTLLNSIDASDNLLTNLDLSSINTVICPDPQTDPETPCQDAGLINVSRNQLISLNVANGFNDLVTIFDASDNPDLFCIQIDAGFTPNGWVKDDWTYYTDGVCVDIYTYVPDDNFEQALIDLGYDDILDNLVLTAIINTLVDLDISGAAITSLEGIEDFVALEILNCSNNNIEDAEFSNNLALLDLNIANNALETFDISTNVAITDLDCSGNLLTNLDVSLNSNLTSLNCASNNLVNLDISSNLMLATLNCEMNQIEFLDITSNTALSGLFCSNNNLFALNLNNGNNASITDFDGTNNPNLFCIAVDDVAFANAAAGWQKDAAATYNTNCGTYVPDDNFEQALINLGIDSDGTLNNFVPTADVAVVTILDVSSLSIEDLTGIQDFVALQDLNCSNNSLSTLNLSANVTLEILDCSMNQIEALELTSNTALTSLLVGNNALNSLNIENGNNANLVVFNSTVNPNLFCINVDDAIVANIPASWQKDDFTTYNGDCENNRFTLIPDAFFEQNLIDLGVDDLIDGQVLTANIEQIQSLDVSDASISDLTGIQDFRSLIELNCSGNFLESLDVSNMIFLERLNCSSNDLLTNDVNATEGVFNTTGTTSLTELFCADNFLTDLDVSQNPSLEILDCSENNLNVLNVSSNTMLRELNCSNNNLLELDISNANLLEDLKCDSNDLNSLLTTNTLNTTLLSISCVNNSLETLNIINYSVLLRLNAGSNEFTQLDTSSNTELEYLELTNNQLVSVNVTNNPDLIELMLAQNALSAIDLSSNMQLQHLNFDFNQITQLDLNSNTNLRSISGSNNQITDLDLSTNTNLIELNFSSNNLSNVILSNDLSLLKRLNLSNNQIESDIDLSTMATSACIYQPDQTEFCPETIIIDVSNNLLSYLDIKNGINGEIATLNASGNPNLTCIQIDDVDNIGISWIKDEAADYSEDCNFGETFVPDDNFEQALIDLGLDSGPLDDFVITANIEGLLTLDISGNGISDLTGIEDFEALENFNCSDNLLSEIDLSSNSNLLSLNCSNNQLLELEVSNNSALNSIDCSNNTISSINLSNNTNLADLNIASNNFTSFLPSDVLSLQAIDCQDNFIIELDFQFNTNLTSLNCQSNMLESLNIKNGQNNLLASFDAQNNPNLLCIESDDGTIPAGATWLIDATTQLAVNCFFGQTFVPDDNFEQTLIDFGYDSGPLDDYVLTATVETITFLDLSGRNISDLTGIEAFVNLTTLNTENNTISVLDLSLNALLVNLDISNNLLSVLDVSNLLNLASLDVSNNDLTALNIELNTALTEVNVSNNNISSLNVSTLNLLETLNCASNQIASLDLSQNSNLNLLFCQSNALVSDQLNVQNGNNENIQVFNAVNNPDLGCILVDNPVAVVNNEDGFYDNWTKDDTASYQIICDDADNDGIPNEDDLCPNTPFGATVDLFGCAIVNLPPDNFTVSITGETCLNSNNGMITIAAQEVYNYTATLTGEGFNQQFNFSNDIDILNLLAGTYTMCITIAEWPDYEICYTIIITEQNPLEVFAGRMADTNQISVDLSGNTKYHVEFNGELLTTYNSSLQFELVQGENILKVSTDLECQGTFEKRFIYAQDFLIYPNPFNESFKIYNGILDDDVSVEIYSALGQLMVSKKLKNRGLEMAVDTKSLPSGIYLVKLKSETSTSFQKIIKR